MTRKLGLVGHIVLWIRTTEAQGIIFKILIHTFLLFVSIAMILSLVGIPFWAFAFKEFIIQNKESEDRQFFQRLFKSATEWGSSEFNRGRFHPISALQVGDLSYTTKNKIFRAFNIKPADQKKFTNHQLVCMAATFCNDFLRRFNLVIKSDEDDDFGFDIR